MKNYRIVNLFLIGLYRIIYPLNKIFIIDDFKELEILIDKLNHQGRYILDPYTIKRYEFFKYGIILYLKEENFNQRKTFIIKIAIPLNHLEYLKLKYS